MQAAAMLEIFVIISRLPRTRDHTDLPVLTACSDVRLSTVPVGNISWHCPFPDGQAQPFD